MGDRRRLMANSERYFPPGNRLQTVGHWLVEHKGTGLVRSRF
jgi:hypothetical protein